LITITKKVVKYFFISKTFCIFATNPPHIHVKCGDGEFTITIKDRVVEGKAKAKTIQIVNQFVDEHEKEILEIWDKAQRGEKIEKIRR
jgi:hypothetical protein